MGRKGIGKLSLFSIAGVIRVETCDGDESNGLVLSAAKIREQMESGNEGDYHPEPVDAPAMRRGTRIQLGELKRGTRRAERALRKRLARRFSVIGPSHKFDVAINGKLITVEDRDYFNKLEYLWHFGDESKEVADHCSNLEEAFPVNDVSAGGHEVSGWIGTVRNAGTLKDDNLNKIVILVRGKMAVEDMLEDFTELGLSSKYLVGEIHADFLDTDDQEDITTSSRQGIQKDDERYQALRKWLQVQLRQIQNKWGELRTKNGTKLAMAAYPVLKDWFASLGPDDRRRAESLFGKISQLKIEKEEDRRILFQNSVLAFESMRYKNNLDALEKVSLEDLESVTKVLSELNDIEATLYYQIVKERLEIIGKLNKEITGNALEKVIQKHLCEHLWLLDPSWDRATNTPYLEETVGKEFQRLDAKLTDEERKGRIDIRYVTTSKKHVIVELKRSGVKASVFKLMEQCAKYRSALEKCLREAGRDDEPVEVVILLGEGLSEWTTPKKKEETIETLDTQNMRVVLYGELIDDAHKSYRAFLEKNKEAGRVYTLIRSLEP